MSSDGSKDAPKAPEKVEFYRHAVGAEERAAVDEALRGLFLTTGAEVRAFEGELAAFLDAGTGRLRGRGTGGDGTGGDGTGGALGVSSCTAALHLAMLTCGVGPGDEVITTPMTFIASANAILYAGATPVFVDVDPATGLLAPERVAAAVTERTRAVLAVHLYGQLCDLAALREVCDRHGLALIEDAAHALEAERDGARPGQLGDAACFSFYATKNVTSGEGGAFVSRHPERLARARTLSLHGMSASAADRHGGGYRHWDMLELGYKYNLTNIQAAMLRPQLRRVGELLERRERRARRYEEAFGPVPGLDFPKVAAGSRSARHLFPLWVTEGRRDDYLLALGERGIGVAVNYRPVHLLTYYRERFGHRPGTLPEAERIGERTLSLPLYPGLGEAAQERVIEAVLEVHRELGGDG